MTDETNTPQPSVSPDWSRVVDSLLTTVRQQAQTIANLNELLGNYRARVEDFDLIDDYAKNHPREFLEHLLTLNVAYRAYILLPPAPGEKPVTVH